MVWIDLLLAVIFVVIGSGCTVIVLIGLPGTWLMIALAFGLCLVQRLWAPSESEWMVPWWVFVIGIVIAGVGEILEFMAGALGAKKGGASKQGMFGALIGGFAGTLIGTFTIPIPIVGSLIGAILGCGIGAILGELKATPDAQLKDTIRPAAGAVIGRILGALAKLPCALVVWIMLSVALMLQPLRTIV
ncbi:MAG: DUF456 domain-containing protein [Planctomycetota bacterium]|nr:DUF456 domain-containing protein [Planctomycetota bacterium]